MQQCQCHFFPLAFAFCFEYRQLMSLDAKQLHLKKKAHTHTHFVVWSIIITFDSNETNLRPRSRSERPVSSLKRACGVHSSFSVHCQLKEMARTFLLGGLLQCRRECLWGKETHTKKNGEATKWNQWHFQSSVLTIWVYLNFLFPTFCWKINDNSVI